MSLVHRFEEIGRDVSILICHACGRRHDLCDFDSGSELLCWECGTGGLIPSTGSKVTERFPAPLGQRFTPVPMALLELSDLKPLERLFVIALDSHRRLMGDEVWPSRERLALLTGMSIDQVKRVAKSLETKGLITKRQPGNRGVRGRGSNRYCLDPLWLHLARIAGAPAPQTRLMFDLNTGTFVEEERPQTQPPEDLRAIQTPFAGDPDPICGAPAPHEVEEEPEPPEAKPEGTRPAPPEHALAAEDLSWDCPF